MHTGGNAEGRHQETVLEWIPQMPAEWCQQFKNTANTEKEEDNSSSATCPHFSPVVAHLAEIAPTMGQKQAGVDVNYKREKGCKPAQYSERRRWHHSRCFGPWHRLGPMHVTRSAVVREWGRNSCVTGTVGGGGGECAQSPHTPIYRDLRRTGAGEEECRRSPATTNLPLPNLNLLPFLFILMVIVRTKGDLTLRNN